MMRSTLSALCHSLLILLSLLSQTAVAEGKRFDGVEIVVGVIDGTAIGGPAEAHAVSWQKRTGGRVRVERIPYLELFKQQMASIAGDSPHFDVLLHASGWTADFFPYLSELPEALANDESFDDIHSTYRDRLMTWDGTWIAVTVDGDLFSGYYRKDLFQDSNNQSAFRERYGYDLGPPDTWLEYRDMAEFFTGMEGPDGMPIYGTTEAFARSGQQIWNFYSRASAYTNHPKFPGAQFFDPDTMGVQIDNPGWLRAAEEYADILQFTPPGSLEYGIIDVREAFIQGRAAMALDWGDIGQMANDPVKSKVRDNVGYFLLPGSREVWNGREWQWEEAGMPHKAPFLAFGGWVASVPKNSRNQEAAWDYIMWYANPENSLHDVVTPGTGINPYRLSHFAQIDAWTEVFSRTSAAEYLGVIQQSISSPYVALDMRLPGQSQYTGVLERALAPLFTGEGKAKDLLEAAAAEWEVITDNLGRERQLAIYRASMGLTGPPARPRPGGAIGKQRIKIGFSQATTTEPWRLLFNKELRREAAKYPEIELLVRDGQDWVEKQRDDVKEFIAAGVDAILISPKEAAPLTPVVSEAFNAGIPVFVLDRDLSNSRYTQFIGGDNLEIGRAAGRYAVKLLGGDGVASGNLVEIWGGMGSTPAWERHRGFHEIVDQESGIRLLTPPRDGDWKQDNAYEIMVDALEKHKNIDLVYSHNDPMAYGAYLAAVDAGREKKISFLGIDGIPAEGVRWVAKGILTATFLYKTPGDEAIRQALRFVKGSPVPRRFTLPTETIDSSNAADILQRAGIQ